MSLAIGKSARKCSMSVFSLLSEDRFHPADAYIAIDSAVRFAVPSEFRTDWFHFSPGATENQSVGAVHQNTASYGRTAHRHLLDLELTTLPRGHWRFRRPSG